MEKELKVKISGHVENLQKALRSGVRDVAKFSEDSKSALEELDKELRVINGNAELFGNTLLSDAKKINAYQTAINKLLREGVSPTSPKVLELASKIDTLSNSMNKAGRQISSTSGVAIEFSRIIQDAPFGIIGIGNNITQLTQNFANLQKEVGSSTKALGVAFRSLFTAGNLLTLGISAATSAFTYYQMQSQRSKSETDSLRDSFEDLLKTLSSIERARVSGERDAQKELVTARQLYNESRNVAISMEQRYRAAQDLINQFPQTFGNLTKEKIVAGEAKNAYDALTTSILANARAEAYRSRLSQVAVRQLEIETKIAEIRKKALEEESQVAGPMAYYSIQKIRKDAQEEINTLQLESFRLSEEAFNIEGKIVEQKEDIVRGIEKAARSTKKLAENTDEWQGYLAKGLLAEESLSSLMENLAIDQLSGLDKAKAEINKKYDEIAKQGKKLYGDMLIAAMGNPEALDKAVEAYQLFLDELEKARKASLSKAESDEEARLKKAEKRSKKLKDIQQIYAEMGAAAVANALEDVLLRGDNVFKALGNEFKRMIIRMIADAAMLRAANLFSGLIGTALGGGGGLIGGLIRIGANILGSGRASMPSSNFVSNAMSNPLGGNSFSPSYASMSGAGKTLIASTQISGRDLRILLHQEDTHNKRFGGGQ